MKKKHSNYEKVFSENHFNYEENKHFLEKIASLENESEINKKLLEELSEKNRNLQQKHDLLEYESKRMSNEINEKTVKFIFPNFC